MKVRFRIPLTIRLIVTPLIGLATGTYPIIMKLKIGKMVNKETISHLIKYLC